MGLYNHIIHISLNLLMDYVMNESHHNALVGCPNILLVERHYLVTKGSPRCDKYGLLHIFRSQFDLIVTREPIHERKYQELSSVIYQYINMRKWEIILGTHSVQISIINTHPYLAILLRHMDDVSHPRRVRSNNQKKGVKLLLNLISDLLGHICARPSKLLLDRGTLFFQR